MSLLKRQVGKWGIVVTEPPLVADDRQLKVEPGVVLDRMVVKQNNQAIIQVLVQWANLDMDESTWEDYSTIVAQFPKVRMLNHNYP